MSDASIDSSGSVLHVRPFPGRSACADDMDTRLGSVGLPVETCYDVYRGLARVCKDSGSSFRALILCMDVLGSFELEFFTVIARARPHLPVYIYGETAEGTRKARALESGAVSDVTDDVLDRLGDRNPVTRRTSKLARPVDTALDDRLAREADDAEPRASALADTAQAEACGSAPDEPVEPAVEERDSQVQVPWLSRDGGPVRRGPGEHPPVEDAAAPDRTLGEDASIRGPHEPLLTDQELRALMGDDLPEASAVDPFDEGDRV
ncbi:MAG: hypothetical protein IH989_05065 [Planctomycetes bacterium]|nr:hypothetical protein [Planctomycetota bacterium]